MGKVYTSVFVQLETGVAQIFKAKLQRCFTLSTVHTILTRQQQTQSCNKQTPMLLNLRELLSSLDKP